MKTKSCIYDNPKTMAREHYVNGALKWAIKATTLASATFTPDTYWDRVKWDSGTFHLGGADAIPATEPKP